MALEQCEVIRNFSGRSPSRLHENITRVADTALPPPFKDGHCLSQDQLSSGNRVRVDARKRSRATSTQPFLQLTASELDEIFHPEKRSRTASVQHAQEERALSLPGSVPAFEPFDGHENAVMMQQDTFPALGDLPPTYEAAGSYTDGESIFETYTPDPMAPTTSAWVPVDTISNFRPVASGPRSFSRALGNCHSAASPTKAIPKPPKRGRKNTNSDPPSRPPEGAVYVDGTSPIPPNILNIVAAIQAIPRKATYPAPTALRAVEGMNQRNGFLTKHSPLMPWYGDTRLFQEKWWKYLYVGAMARQNLVREMGESDEPGLVEETKRVVVEEEKENRTPYPEFADQMWVAPDRMVHEDEEVQQDFDS